MNWDDLKYLLTVYRKGTLSAASRDLGVNQTTVTRRLAKLEKNLGVTLLARTGSTLSLTAEGQQALEFIETAEDQFFKLEKHLHQNTGNKGTLKITAVDSLIDTFLLPSAPQFLAKHPGLQMAFHGSVENMEISKLEADIAIRLARPVQGSMIVSKLCDIGFSVYGTEEMQDRSREHGLQSMPWAVYDTSLWYIPEMKWLAASYPDARICVQSHSAGTIAKALKHNLAVGILPCFLGDSVPGLVRISGPLPILSREIWLITHQDTYKTPRIRAGTSWLKNLFAQQNSILCGKETKL